MDQAKKVTVTVTYEDDRGEHEETRTYQVTLGLVPPEHIFSAVKERVGMQIDAC